MDKIVVVTGGSKGLGLQIAADLSRAGYRVLSVSRNQAHNETLTNSMENVEFFTGSIADDTFINDFSNQISNRYGKIDVLVNNAGIIHAGGIEQLTKMEWEEMFEVNVTGVFTITKALLPLLKKSNNASIINISSISSKMTGSSMAYSACKAAVDMMTQSLAKELAQYRIRVNSVNPGIINTGFQVNNQVIGEHMYGEFLEEVGKTYPLGIGTAKNVSDLVCFLISDQASWISGSNYVIDGARSTNI